MELFSIRIQRTFQLVSTLYLINQFFIAYNDLMIMKNKQCR